MQQSDEAEEYLETVRQQIRWKKARRVVVEEIRAHLEDQEEAYLKNGSSQEAAAHCAVAEMGDPVVVGEQLDRIHRPRPDWILLAMTAALLLLGLVVPAFIGGTVMGGFFGESWLWNQAIYVGIAIPVMFAAYFMDFTILGKYPKSVLVIFYVAVLFCFFLTQNRFAGHRSCAITDLLLLFPTVFAGFVYGMRGKGYGGLILCMAAVLLSSFLALIMPDITILFFLLAACFIILTGVVLRGWFCVGKKASMAILLLPCAFILLAAGFALYGGNGIRRIQYILNPGLAPNSYGYLGNQLQQILWHSKPIGAGMLFNGLDPNLISGRVTDMKTNYLLTYIAYHFGWIALILILGLFSAFFVRAGKCCKKQKSMLGFLTCLAVLSTLAVQCFIYIVPNFGILLFQPLSLPLISFGGQFLVIDMFLIGFLLSVFRTGDLAVDKVVKAENSGPKRFIRYRAGRLIINLR